MRIVSLLPSATEIVDAVGAAGQLVGRSHECDFPAGLQQLPVLTRPRRKFPRPSGEIDRAVRAVLEDALTVYELDVDLLRSLDPDVIVTQSLCDVCAVSLDDVRSALAKFAGDRVRVVSLGSMRLAEVWNDVRTVGQALSRGPEGESAARSLQQRIHELAERSTRARGSAPRQKVLTVEWLDPVMIGGTWMPELVEAAGGRALVTEPGQHAPTWSREQLQELAPDLVLIKPCGFEIERTREELELLATQLPWDTWKAVREGQVYLADGNAFFNRPGPRLVESAEILAACLDPATFRDEVQKHASNVRRVTPELNLEQI